MSTTSSAPKRNSAWVAFWAGLARALCCWPVVLLFYAALLLVSGLLLLPLARALIGWIGHSLSAGEIAEGVPGWLFSETLAGPLQGSPDTTSFGDWTLLLLLSLPAWPFLLAVPATLLSPGAIAVYAGSAPRTEWRRLGRGLADYAPTFLLLLLIEVTLYELALLLTVLLAALVVAVSQSPWTTLLVVPILALVIVAIPWWFEYARVLAVVEEQRNVIQSLGRAFTFLWRHLGPAAALAVYHFVLALLPYLPFFLLTWLLPTSWWASQVFLQQVLVLALVGTRLARTAGQVQLVQRSPVASGQAEPGRS